VNLNGRSSLDPRWVKHHMKVVEGFMLATIKVVRKIPGQVAEYNQATGTYSNTVTEVWTGKARIQPFGIIGDMVVGQDTASRRLMRVQVDDLETGINIDDMITVLESVEAPELELFTLEVRGSISGSNPWVTDLVCEANTKHA
jgi:hypothetical protein